MAAASIGEYERAATALGDYAATIERGLGVCFQDRDLMPQTGASITGPAPPCAIIFGTDQGLVGRFNDAIADYALESSLVSFTEIQKPLVYVVGERLNERLNDAGVNTQAHFKVPDSVRSITSLIGQILLSIEDQQPITAMTELHLFYNRPANGSRYNPITQRLLPLDRFWCMQLAQEGWPGNNIPELLGDKTITLGVLIREHLFVSLFRASAESLSSENASRLAAMQRADKNIEELLNSLQRNYHRLRQAGIDEEMFDVIAGSNQS